MKWDPTWAPADFLLVNNNIAIVVKPDKWFVLDSLLFQLLFIVSKSRSLFLMDVVIFKKVIWLRKRETLISKWMDVIRAIAFQFLPKSLNLIAHLTFLGKFNVPFLLSYTIIHPVD